MTRAKCKLMMLDTMYGFNSVWCRKHNVVWAVGCQCSNPNARIRLPNATALCLVSGVIEL